MTTLEHTKSFWGTCQLASQNTSNRIVEIAVITNIDISTWPEHIYVVSCMWKSIMPASFVLNHLKLLRISISGHAVRISCFGTFRRATFYVYIFKLDTSHLDVNIKGYYLWLHALMKTLTAGDSHVCLFLVRPT